MFHFYFFLIISELNLEKKTFALINPKPFFALKFNQFSYAQLK